MAGLGLCLWRGEQKTLSYRYHAAVMLRSGRELTEPPAAYRPARAGGTDPYAMVTKH